MSGFFPEPEPRRQKSSRVPRVTVGHIDPCLLFLEATEAGEIPVLFVCWARSSVETRDVGGTTHLKLGDVTILKGKPLTTLFGWNMEDGQTEWSFARHQTMLPEVNLTHTSTSGWSLKGFPFSSNDSSSTAYGFQGSLKFIEAETDLSLQEHDKARSSSSAPYSRPSTAFVKTALTLGPVEWLSLVNALASLRNEPIPTPHAEVVPSLFRRFVSSVAKKLIKA